MSNKQRVFGYGLLVVLSIAATIASFQFVRPVDCHQLCRGPAQAPCPPGDCRFGEQQAGFPIPMVRDAETGSPTGGWGILGDEDYIYMNGLAVVGNILFYGGIFWFLGVVPVALRTRRLQRIRVPLMVVLLIVSAGVLIGGWSYRPSPDWRPPAGAPPEVMLRGTWQSTEPTAGAPIILRFYENQQIIWSQLHDVHHGAGEYTWVDDHTIRMQHDLRGHGPGRTFCLRQGGTGHPFSQTCGSQSHMFVKKIKKVPCCRRRIGFSSDQTPGLNADRVSRVQVHWRQSNADDRCADMPALLVQACHDQALRPTASPAGESVIAPTATAEPPDPPSPYDVTVTMVDVDLHMTVTVDAATLTLQPISGRTYTFERVTWE